MEMIPNTTGNDNAKSYTGKKKKSNTNHYCLKIQAKLLQTNKEMYDNAKGTVYGTQRDKLGMVVKFHQWPKPCYILLNKAAVAVHMEEYGKTQC